MCGLHRFSGTSRIVAANVADMSRFRLDPTPSQVATLEEHCAHARYVWNLAVEQNSWWRRGRDMAPGFQVQSRQLTEARTENPWLRNGSAIVQQQALRDYDQARSAHFQRKKGKPTWRKAGVHEGFRIVGPDAQKVRRLSRKVGEVKVPKLGWVRFRWSRAVPAVKSYRVTRDRSGRWHIAFAAIPEAVPAPGNGKIVGIDRGVAVSAALSDGRLLHAPRHTAAEAERLVRLQRRLARCQKGSRRRARLKNVIARLSARQRDRRKDWVERISTMIARDFDLVVIEKLAIKPMTRSARGTPDAPGTNVKAKAALNRGILSSGWGLLGKRLEEKAPDRVLHVNPAYTSQQCFNCKAVDRNSRESQALFRCTSCGRTAHADVNAALNIRDGVPLRGRPADGRAVAARGGGPVGQPVNREPQLLHTSP